MIFWAWPTLARLHLYVVSYRQCPLWLTGSIIYRTLNIYNITHVVTFKNLAYFSLIILRQCIIYVIKCIFIYKCHIYLYKVIRGSFLLTSNSNVALLKEVNIIIRICGCGSSIFLILLKLLYFPWSQESFQYILTKCLPMFELTREGRKLNADTEFYS